MATYKTSKVAMYQYKYIVMAIYKQLKVAITQQNNTDMATYKHLSKAIVINRNHTQQTIFLKQSIFRLSIYFQQINIVHKNI